MIPEVRTQDQMAGGAGMPSHAEVHNMLAREVNLLQELRLYNKYKYCLCDQCTEFRGA